ncbi:unnamed protein product [Closterium sp. NIES-54]
MGQQETFSPQVLSELFPQRCVTGSVEAAALDASESAAALGACESAAALGESESAAALGARASPATGPSSAEALHTFTLDSGASRCFFRECTTLTPLAAPVPDVWVDTFIPGGQRVAICMCSRTGCHLATFTRRPRSSLYTLTTASAQVAEASQVAASSRMSASGQLAASYSCRVLSHQTLLWHHCLSHPSLPRLRSMHPRLLSLWRSLLTPLTQLRGMTPPLTTRRPLAALHAWRPTLVFRLSRLRCLCSLMLWTLELRLLVLSLGFLGCCDWGADSAGSWGPASLSGGGAVGDHIGGPRAGQPPQPDLLDMLSPQAIRAWIVQRGSLGGGGYGPTGARATSPRGTAGAGGTGGTAGTGGAASAVGTRGASGAGGAGGAAGARGTGAGGTGGAGAAGPGGAPTGGAGAVGVGGAIHAGGATGAAGTGGIGSTAGARGAGAAGAGGTAGAGGAGGATGSPGTGGAGGTAGAGGAGAGGTKGTGDAGAAGPRGACTRGTGAARVGGAAGTGGATGATGRGATGASGAACAVGAGGAAGAGGAGAAGGGGAGAAGTALRRPFFYPQPQTSLPPPDSSMTERREIEIRASTPVHDRRVARPHPPAAPSTHGMALRPSSVPQRVVLPEPPASSLPHVPDPESDLARAASPTVTCLLATVVTDPDLESTAAFALVTELVDFAARSRLDYVVSLVIESKSLECLAAALPRFASMLLCPETDPYALDIPTSRSYAEAIAGEYSSQGQTAMDVEMASWKSTCTYVDEVPPPRANIVDDMWIFRVKRPPGSQPAFKARYVARDFNQPQGDTLRTTLAALGFATSSADPSLFLRTDTTLPPFYVIVYVDDLVFATADTEALALVLQRFAFQFSSLQPTPLSTGHSISAPPSDESVEPTGPYPELVGCLICEVEIYAGAMAAQELRWLTYLLTDLGERPRSPPILYVDNKSMLALCHGQRLEHKTKHIALCYFLAHELQ